MKLYIKNMVSLRCKIMVNTELKKLGISPTRVELGVVELTEEPSEKHVKLLQANLKALGLELLEDKKSILVENIKNAIIEMVHYSEEFPKVNNSEYLSEKLGYEYNYLSNVFSEVNGITIQQYLIHHKVERVKELLLYGELTLSEIAYKLNYSSVAHLSNQFHQVTGLRPSKYRKSKVKKRNNLDEI